MEVDEGLIAELQRRATGAYVHWALSQEHAYRGLARSSRTARTPERRRRAEAAAREVERQIREALAELRETGHISAATRRAGP